MSTKARSALGSFMVQAVAHCGMECKFKQLNVRAEKVFLTLRSLRYALCVMTRGSDLLQSEINSASGFCGSGSRRTRAV